MNKSFYTMTVFQDAHSVTLGSPGDCESEFIREVSAKLMVSRLENDEPKVAAEIEALLIRGGESMNYGLSVIDLADAHSGGAESVASAIFGREDNKIDDYAQHCVHDVIYIERMLFLEDHLRSDIDLWFVTRFVSQFDVDLAVVKSDFKRATKIGFKKIPGSREYLMRTTALIWPELPPLEAPYDATVQ
jgi:hypothetical protein